MLYSAVFKGLILFLDINISGKSRKRKFEVSRENYLLHEEEYSYKEHLMRVRFMEERRQWEKEEHELKIKLLKVQIAVQEKLINAQTR